MALESMWIFGVASLEFEPGRVEGQVNIGSQCFLIGLTFSSSFCCLSRAMALRFTCPAGRESSHPARFFGKP
jgi:hypothetical protein